MKSTDQRSVYKNNSILLWWCKFKYLNTITLQNPKVNYWSFFRVSSFKKTNVKTKSRKNKIKEYKRISRQKFRWTSNNRTYGWLDDFSIWRSIRFLAIIIWSSRSFIRNVLLSFIWKSTSLIFDSHCRNRMRIERHGDSRTKWL